MQGPPAGAVHQGDGHEGHADHDDADADGRELGALRRQSRRREQARRVVEDLRQTNRGGRGALAGDLGLEDGGL